MFPPSRYQLALDSQFVHSKGRAHSPAALRSGNGFTPSPRHSSAGVTMVELVVAIVVFAIAAVGSMVAFSHFNRTAAVSRNMTAARVAVDALINAALTAPYDIKKTPEKIAPVLALTGEGTDEDGDGVTDGVLVTGSQNIINSLLSSDRLPLISTVDNSPASGLISARIYRKVTTLEQRTLLVTFTAVYTYRGKTYSYKQSTARTPGVS